MNLAVFDVDGTLTRSDSLKWFGWYVFRRGGLRYSYFPGFLLSLLKYLVGRNGAAELKTALLRTLLGGTRVEQADQRADQFNRGVLLKRLHPAALARIHWHREQNHRIVFLSASPDIYLNGFARMLGADTLICTRIVSRDGSLTGELAGENCKGEEKLKRLSNDPALRDANWRESYGYGNSFEDVAFLSAVGNPTAVNPDRGLKRTAAQRGWNIERWR